MSAPASAYSTVPIEGRLSASASVVIARKVDANSPSSVTTTESTELLAMAVKARVNSFGLCAWKTSTTKLKGAAASCIAGMIGLLIGLSGFESAAAWEICGHASLSSSSRFALSCGRKKVDPVRLPSGLARLVTRPVARSEEHTSELQSLRHLVCRLLL